MRLCLYFTLQKSAYEHLLPAALLTMTIGLCVTRASMSQLTPVTATLNLAAISHTVAPAPGPLALSAIWAIFKASSACKLPPATPSGVDRLLSLKNLPATYAQI